MRTSEGLGSKRRRSASAANSSTGPRAPFTGLALSRRGVVFPRARALLSSDPARRCAFRSPGRRWRPAASASRRRSAFATKPRQRRGFPVAAKGPGRFRSRLGFDPTRPRRSRLCGARRTPRSSPVASKDASWPPRPAPRCSKFSSRGSSTSRAPCRGPVRSTSSCCTRAHDRGRRSRTRAAAILRHAIRRGGAAPRGAGSRSRCARGRLVARRCRPWRRVRQRRCIHLRRGALQRRMDLPASCVCPAVCFVNGAVRRRGRAAVPHERARRLGGDVGRQPGPRTLDEHGGTLLWRE